MTDPDGATGTQCDALISAYDPAGLCPRIASEAQGRRSDNPPASASAPWGACRKLPLAAAMAAMGAILFGGLSFALGPEEQAADAVAHYLRGLELNAQGGKLKEEIAEYQAAIQIKPDFADARYKLGHAQAMERVMDQVPEASRPKPESVKALRETGHQPKAPG